MGRREPCRAGPAHAEVAEREVEADRVGRIDEPQGRGDLLGGAPAGVGPAGEPEPPCHPVDVGVERHDQRRARHAGPGAEVDRVRAADHPAQEEVPALGGARAGGVGEQVAQAARPPTAEQRRHRRGPAQLGGEGGQGRAERRRVTARGREEGREPGAQRAVGAAQVADGREERGEVGGLVEAVAEPGEPGQGAACSGPPADGPFPSGGTAAIPSAAAVGAPRGRRAGDAAGEATPPASDAASPSTAAAGDGPSWSSRRTRMGLKRSARP